MKRTFSGLLLGIPVTFFLFVFMSLLVQAKVVIVTPPIAEPPTIERAIKNEPPTSEEPQKLPELVMPP